ncbi:hypothetical protein ACFVYC_13675 [Pseudarthrobacter sp. NPDC058329]|uniref:hypothetical protein n=1 Tax=Pseudarthrobacter sp. NPDC058329 TaxID=3346448 RepID=UPI0036D9012F
MKRREIWGSALIVAASLCAWADTAINEAFWAAARQGLLLYAGIPGDAIAAWFRIAALFLAASGLLLLLPALIGRVPRNVPRRVIGWTTTVVAAAASPFIGIILLFTLLSAFGIGDTAKITAADGQSVLITQDGFDGDIVEIYTEHDGLHYKQVRRASEISTWPRVKDQNCRLNTADNKLQLLCGDKTVAVEPNDPNR